MPWETHGLTELERIVSEAGRLAVRARQSLTIEVKDDGTLVTNGDPLVETYLRGALPALVPKAAFWGEELGFDRDQGEGLWLIDPIDGTTNYAFGSPLWGVSVGYAEQGRIVAGAIALPDLHENYVSSVGHGVLRNGVNLAPLRGGPIERFEPVSVGRDTLALLPDVPGKPRCSGSFVIDGTFLVSGRMRGLVGYREKLYDVAPSVLFAEELGADIRYADGDAFELGPLFEDRKIERPWLMFPPRSGYRQ